MHVFECFAIRFPAPVLNDLHSVFPNCFVGVSLSILCKILELHIGNSLLDFELLFRTKQIVFWSEKQSMLFGLGFRHCFHWFSTWFSKLFLWHTLVIKPKNSWALIWSLALWFRTFVSNRNCFEWKQSVFLGLFANFFCSFVTGCFVPYSLFTLSWLITCLYCVFISSRKWANWEDSFEDFNYLLFRVLCRVLDG